jgi:hypothetical protein
MTEDEKTEALVRALLNPHETPPAELGLSNVYARLRDMETQTIGERMDRYREWVFMRPDEYAAWIEALKAAEKP